MLYNHILTYHYSGTGNSYRVAKWINEAAGESDAACTLLPISSPYPAEDNIPSGNATLTGLVFPVHGFTAPWPVIRFTMRLPRQQGTHALVIATRGGTKFGSLIVPGLEGTAAWLVALILRLKGFRIRGVKGVDMPANWTAVMPGYDEENSRQIINRSQPGAMAFIRKVLSGQRLLQGWIPLLAGLVLLPVSFGYLFAGRFFLAKLLYASSRCNGCGLCAKHCPSQAIRMTNGNHTNRPFWTFSCHSCMRCMNLCPQNAIETNIILVAAMIWLFTLPLDALLLHGLGKLTASPTLVSSPMTHFLLQTGYVLGGLWALYALFHVLLGIRWFNRLITTITPTHYFKRYHEPDTDLKNV
jgi:Pyruvate/2-oxoacid:ferredoxin oxidoreductase delta subunit